MDKKFKIKIFFHYQKAIVFKANFAYYRQIIANQNQKMISKRNDYNSLNAQLQSAQDKITQLELEVKLYKYISDLQKELLENYKKK